MFFSRCLRIFSFPPFLCVYLNIFQVFSNRLVDLRFHPAGPEFDPVAATGNQSSLTRNIFVGVSNESTIRKKSQYLRWCLFYSNKLELRPRPTRLLESAFSLMQFHLAGAWSAGRWSARPKWTMKACQTVRLHKSAGRRPTGDVSCHRPSQKERDAQRAALFCFHSCAAVIKDVCSSFP